MVVVNWNRKELLRACLKSLAAQAGVGFETIVVDNGSSDGSADLAEREFGAIVIRNAENRGFCAANNQGIAAAQGEFIALLNNDAEAEPGWLAALRTACSQAPDIGMAASKVLVWEDPRRIDKVGHLIFPDGQNRGRGSGALDRGQFDREEEVLWPDGCAAMYRKRMLDEIGGFDEDFFAYGDDAELGLRARIAGLALSLHSAGGGAAPSQLDPGERLGAAAGTDRAQSRPAGAEAVSVEPAVAESGVLRDPDRGGDRGGGTGGRRYGALSRAARQMVHGAGADSRRSWARCGWRREFLRKRADIARIRRLAPGEVRRLILNNRLRLRELA